MTEIKNQEEINKAFDKYKNALDRIDERRLLWNSEIKSIIIKSLTNIQQTHKLNWEVQRIENLKNYQTINISFYTTNSGIVEIKDKDSDEKGLKKFVKHGGYLAYSQLYHGKISVFIGYPHIDEWVEQMENEFINLYEPNEINEDLIESHVITFLDTMAEWEGTFKVQIERRKVGY